jgi:hypothetical protein
MGAPIPMPCLAASRRTEDKLPQAGLTEVASALPALFLAEADSMPLVRLGFLVVRDAGGLRCYLNEMQTGLAARLLAAVRPARQPDRDRAVCGRRVPSAACGGSLRGRRHNPRRAALNRVSAWWSPRQLGGCRVHCTVQQGSGPASGCPCPPAGAQQGASRPSLSERLSPNRARAERKREKESHQSQLF